MGSRGAIEPHRACTLAKGSSTGRRGRVVPLGKKLNLALMRVPLHLGGVPHVELEVTGALVNKTSLQDMQNVY